MPRGSSSSSGPVPKRVSQRRRGSKPKSYGDAEPTTGQAAAGRPSLGIDDPMPQIRDLWNALQESAEAVFYSDADWHRVRTELLYGDRVLRELRYGSVVGVDKDGNAVISTKVNAQAWKQFQDALTELLVSPAAKRRAGIELKPPTDERADRADAKILQLAEKLKAQ